MIQLKLRLRQRHRRKLGKRGRDRLMLGRLDVRIGLLGLPRLLSLTCTLFRLIVHISYFKKQKKEPVLPKKRYKA